MGARVLYTLLKIQKSGGHFHYRSKFEGATGIGDIEIGCSGAVECDSLVLDDSKPIYPRPSDD